MFCAMRRKLLWWMTRARDTARDLYHDVDTYAVVPADELKMSGADRANSGCYDYDPTPWRALPRLLRLASLPTEGFTFIDFGCGKGRILLSALAHPFARVVGVEFSPYLCQIARSNLSTARFLRRRCAEAQVVCGDAADYPIPAGPVLFFFYNPFSYQIMERVLNNIVCSYQSSCRPMYLIFYATSAQIPLISKFLQRQSFGNSVHCISLTVRKRTIYVYRLPQPAIS
jgi:SAM-dependent methyltransferase